jgi:hypothetical protein
MDNISMLVVAMATQCRALIQKSKKTDSDLPQVLHRNHLLWMCDRIENLAEEWPATKLHRWIGFVQCGMLANRMVDFGEVKAMFDEAKNAYGGSGEDEDLIDHLDPTSSYEFDVGGES